MKQPFAHFLILLVFMSCLYLGEMKKRSQKKTHVAKHNNKRWKIKTVDGRTTVKGKDYTNCTKENIPIEDLAEPCRLLAKELKFMHQLTKNNKNRKPDLGKG